MSNGARPENRLLQLRECGVPLSESDERRVLHSVEISIAALDKAVESSLFDTEPCTFDVVLRRLAKATP